MNTEISKKSILNNQMRLSFSGRTPGCQSGDVGSIPISRTNSLLAHFWLERSPDKREVPGSNPGQATIKAL